MTVNHQIDPPASSADWLECITIGAIAATCAFIGHNIYICNSVPEGIAFTIVLPLLFFFVPASLPGYLLVIYAVTVGARTLSSRPLFKGRPMLMAACIAIGSLLIGNWLSYAFRSKLGCSVGVWT